MKSVQKYVLKKYKNRFMAQNVSLEEMSLEQTSLEQL
jgi:hypothetical protein